jgi:ATP-dependent helicase/nuclease subunit A
MSQLKILTASAGSGKTFNLTREYLKLALKHKPSYFSRILGMTFTNKAAGEMKENILKELDNLARDPQSSPHFDALAREKDAPFRGREDQLQKRAKATQKAILLNYHDFSLSTIDSFFQRIVRAFFRELNLASNFDVELNSQEVASDAIDHHLTFMLDDDPLIPHINDIQDQLVKDEKSPNYKRELNKLAGELFKEQQLPDTATEADTLRKILGQIEREKSQIEKGFFERRDKLGSMLKQLDIEPEEFSGKGRSIPSMILSRDEKRMMELPSLTTIKNDLENPDKWVAKSKKGEEREKLEEGFGCCSPIALDIREYLLENRELYYTNVLLKKDFLSFAVLSYIKTIIDNYIREENIFLLSKTYEMLRNFMTESESPLIYERIGNRYKHIFIDEFQDTSRYQYDNIKPLLTESLATGNYNLIVGDIKQAVYRFRAGDWALLGGQIQRDFSHFASQEPLTENWRSRREVIEFNNQLYPSISDAIQHHLTDTMEEKGYQPEGEEFNLIGQIYSGENAVQNYPKNPQVKGVGHVQMEFLDFNSGDGEDTGITELIYQRLENQLLNLEEKGYSAGDIAILARKNDELKELIPLLSESAKRYPESGMFEFYSEQVLTVSDSPAVQMVLSVFRLTAYGIQDKREKRRMLLQLSYFAKKAGLRADFLKASADWYSPSSLQASDELENLVQSGASMGLSGFFKQAIKVLQLGQEAGSGQFYYLSALEDEVSEYVEKYGNDLIGFLEYWEDKGSSKTIEPPGGEDKMQLMTIHKSKGLSFEIVFLPFSCLQLSPDHTRTNILWVTDERFKSSRTGMPLDFPVKLSKDMQESRFRETYWREYYNHFTDELNNYYVATTRPRQALFIYAFQKETNSTKKMNGDRLQDHLKQFAQNSLEEIPNAGQWENHQIFAHKREGYQHLNPKEDSGIKEGGTEVLLPQLHASGSLPPVKSSWNPVSLTSAPKEERHAVEEGLLLHRILELVHVKTDIPGAIRTVVEEGHIGKEEKGYWLDRIHRAMALDPVADWFEEGLEVLNERDILVPGGKRYRPDRVVIRNGKAVIIDYKTGSQHPSYAKQLETYAGAISKMGYSEVEGWLFYTDILKTDRIV